MSDEDLARRVAVDRDRAAFAELVGRHLPRLRRLLAALLAGSPEDMADAEQEILAGLWTTMDQFRFASSFRTWLYRFARNRAIDLLRREGRHRRRAEAAAHAARAGAANAADGDPVRVVEGDERRQCVREALATLAVDDRALVVMKHVEDLGIAEIAAATGLPEGTVKSRLHRARARLARGLGEAEGVWA